MGASPNVLPFGHLTFGALQPSHPSGKAGGATVGMAPKGWHFFQLGGSKSGGGKEAMDIGVLLGEIDGPGS